MHYNGRTFDWPFIARELLRLVPELGPPAPFGQLDLLTEMRRFKWDSRKLDWVSRRLGLSGKQAHSGFDM